MDDRGRPAASQPAAEYGAEGPPPRRTSPAGTASGNWTGQPGYDPDPPFDATRRWTRPSTYESDPQPAASQRWAEPPPPRSQEPPPHLPPPDVPQAPPAPTEPDEYGPQERVWVDLRLQVASRLRGVNARHCHEAFDRIGKRNALGPHGVVLFYTTPDQHMPHGYRLLIATRLFLAGPESDDLPRVLHDLSRTAAGNVARATAQGRRWDPRGPEGSMVNGGDLDMPRDASYVGVGVTTLDSDEGPWHTVANSVRSQPLNTPRPRSVFDLSGQGLAWLIDGTALRMVRDPHRRLGDDGITSNRRLDASRRWPYDPYADLTEQGDQWLRAAWAQLAGLHRILTEHLVAGRQA
ncbi:hypothetical protein [Micromonospora tarensis]|uniref:hypothetical protein n=1 Tax=Micromonospora tarensis TaxID=2806100 RepID=UPI001EE3E905|nr:hypothetical protein [Micromonospora tarensis]